MKFENYVIYEDENQRIEIDGMVHHFFQSLNVNQVEIPSVVLNTMIPVVYAQLTSKGVDVKKNDRAFCSKAIILSYGVSVNFLEPFDKFNDAADIIGLSTDVDKERQEIEEMFDAYNEAFLEENANLYVGIFDKEVNSVKGWFAYADEEQLLILFWGFRKPDLID